jgi:hypothetical protein
MKLRRKILLVLVVLLVLVPSVLLLLVATTETGLQMVTQRLGHMGIVTLTVRGVRGTLVRGFSAEYVRIESKYSDVQITKVEGHLALAPLLVQRISFPDLRADTLKVIVHHVEPAPGGAKPHLLPRLLEVHAADARVGRVAITAPNGVEVDFTNTSGAATVYPRQLRVHRAQLQYQDALINAKGRMLAESPWGLEGDADVVWRMPRQPEWHATSQFKGDFDELPLTVTIDRPFHALVLHRRSTRAGNSMAAATSAISTCSHSVAARRWA